MQHGFSTRAERRTLRIGAPVKDPCYKRVAIRTLIFVCVCISSIVARAQPSTMPATTRATSTTSPTTLATTSPTTSPASAPSSQPVFDVKSFGAAGDGQSLDTGAIQKALDACAVAGGGVVSIPAGKFRSGSVFLHSHIALRIEEGATLVGSIDETDYPIINTRIAGIEMLHPAALVNAIDCEDVAVVGAGTIDGSGQHWWEIFWQTRQKRGRGVDFQVLRPRLVCFTNCTTVRVTGLSLQNPPF